MLEKMQALSTKAYRLEDLAIWHDFLGKWYNITTCLTWAV